MGKKRGLRALPALLKAASAAALLWLLAPYVGLRGGPPDPDACPVRYDRLSAAEVARGEARPYLFGGAAHPACRNCRSKREWAGICTYKAGQLCKPGAPPRLLELWHARGFTLPLTITPCDFWKYLRGRTLFFVGDSMTLDFYKAMKCFMFEFWNLKHYPVVPRDKKLQKRISLVPAVPPDCVHLPAGTRICYIRVDTGGAAVERLLPLLPRFSKPADLLVANFGLHHWKDYEAVLTSFAAYCKAHREELPMVLWQQTAQQHFVNDEGSGEWPGEKTAPPYSCAPIANFSVVGQGTVRLQPGTQDTFQMLTGNWRNSMADPIMRHAEIPIIPSFNESLWMWQYHRDNGAGHECTHFCHPSAPQVFVVELLRLLEWVADRIPPLPGASPAAATA